MARDKDWGKLVAKAAACMTSDLKLALHAAAFATETSMSAVIRNALEAETARLLRLAQRRNIKRGEKNARLYH